MFNVYVDVINPMINVHKDPSSDADIVCHIMTISLNEQKLVLHFEGMEAIKAFVGLMNIVVDGADT